MTSSPTVMARAKREASGRTWRTASERPPATSASRRTLEHLVRTIGRFARTLSGRPTSWFALAALGDRPGRIADPAGPTAATARRPLRPPSSARSTSRSRTRTSRPRRALTRPASRAQRARLAAGIATEDNHPHPLRSGRTAATYRTRSAVLALTVVAFIVARVLAERDVRRDSDRRAEVAAVQIRGRIDQAASLTESLRRFMLDASSTGVTSDQFARNALRWLGPARFSAAAWVERVPDSRRAAYERRIGQPIVTPDARYGVAPLGSRPSYLPATLVSGFPPMAVPGSI